MVKLKDAIGDQPVNIVTHNDPDGLLAAAICTRGLESISIDDIEFYFESPSIIQQDRSRFLDVESDNFIGGFIIILDLPYNPLARVWIDHHASEMEVTPSEKTVFAIQDTTKCAAALVHDFFTKQLQVKEKLCDPAFLEYVNARDIGQVPKTMTKDYETFSLAVMEDRDDYKFFTSMVDALADGKDVKVIAAEGPVLIKAKKQHKMINRGLELLQDLFVAGDKEEFLHEIDVESDKETGDASKKRIFFYNQFLLFDFSDLDNLDKERKFGASIPYYIIGGELQKMGMQYSFLLGMHGDDKTGEIHATISINQALDEVVERFDVGEFAKQQGGGGHRFVAGFIVGPERFLQVIANTLDFFHVE
ncbi:MAG TPA: hypothetical protein VKM55_20915 [Candidatus Lokiarchaeia archaeon]|nr:hypothetical protein [Candidatus Lokiarchaeia archaeon]